jgi:hypothetical protein
MTLTKAVFIEALSGKSVWSIKQTDIAKQLSSLLVQNVAFIASTRDEIEMYYL